MFDIIPFLYSLWHYLYAGVRCRLAEGKRQRLVVFARMAKPCGCTAPSKIDAKIKTTKKWFYLRIIVVLVGQISSPSASTIS